jgi:hypothetical protein
VRKNVSKKAWDGIAKDYSKIIIPNRPSADNCRIYGETIRNFLKGRENPRIMIMGSTPELRSVLCTEEYLQGAEVFCADLSKDMFDAMSNFVIKGEFFKERLVKCSWLDTGFEKESFDLIVGDEVICNVPSDKHAYLFRELGRILKNNGAWITRHNFYTKEDTKCGVKKILKEIADGVSRGSIDFQYGINLINVKIFYYLGWADHWNNSIANCFRVIKKEYDRSFRNHKLGKIVKELINLHEKNFVPLSGEYKWHVLSKEKSRDELKKFFIIEKELHAEDYVTAKNSPIYLLKKK